MNCARCGALLPEGGALCPFCPDSLVSLTRSALERLEIRAAVLAQSVTTAEGNDLLMPVSRTD